MNFGIVGTGSIAGKLAKAINNVEGAVLYGVASRDLEKSSKFAIEYGAVKSFGRYEDLYSCKEIDMVYVATPNNCHKNNTLDALKHGKAVLCEKPFALNYKESKEMVDYSKEMDLLLIEAMWTKYFPAVKKMKEVISSGVIGDIVSIYGDLSYPMGDSKERLIKKELGGGALLDLGVYPITLVHYLMGIPEEISATAVLTETGVDETISATLKYKGALATISASFNAVSTKEFLVCGTKGWFRLNDNLGFPNSISCYIDGVGEDHKNYPISTLGYEYQIKGVMEDFTSGKKVSSTVDLNDTLEIMKIMDSIREITGIKFDNE